MSPEVGLLALDGTAQDNFLGVEMNRPRWYSEETAERVDAAVKKIVDDAYADAVAILKRERPKLDELAEALLKRESLDENEIREVIAEAEPQAA